MLEYLAACERLSLRLLGALCAGLGLPEDTLARHFKPVHTSFARLNHYPLDDLLEPETAAILTPLGDVALHHHSDAGALTVLLQDDVGGLQVETGAGWVDVIPIDGALVVNVGDMMQIWSNDRYQAAVQRVRSMAGRPRYSIPFFFNPAYRTNVDPLPTADAGRPRYRTVNWGEYRRIRADGDFADYGSRDSDRRFSVVTSSLEVKLNEGHTPLLLNTCGFNRNRRSAEPDRPRCRGSAPRGA